MAMSKFIGVESEHVKRKLEQFAQELKKRGFRITVQRLTVAAIVLSKIKEHPSFMEILEEARKHVPGVSASTVYNTLQLLEKLGLITSFSVRGETHYDQPHKHVNIVCLDTNKIYDLEKGDEVIGVLEKKGLNVRNVVVYANCSEKASEPG